jgi:hypothetical protein
VSTFLVCRVERGDRQLDERTENFEAKGSCNGTELLRSYKGGEGNEDIFRRAVGENHTGSPHTMYNCKQSGRD